MKISTKGRYALRLMLDLAMNGENNVVRIKDIAERQQISDKYLEQIISVLNKAGYVRSAPEDRRAVIRCGKHRRNTRLAIFCV